MSGLVEEFSVRMDEWLAGAGSIGRSSSSSSVLLDFLIRHFFKRLKRMNGIAASSWYIFLGYILVALL